MFSPEEFLDLDHTDHRKLFESVPYVWDALKQVASYLQFRLKPAIEGRMIGKPFISGAVFIGRGTTVEQGAMFKGPAWIGEDCEVRNGCYIRENVVVGNGVVLGNSCEFKNCIILDEAEIPHFSYVGDSILGYKAHLGAGVKISNIKLMPGNVTVEINAEFFDTGLRKFGALLGDNTDIGCNSVLNPGSIIGRGSLVYPNTNWRGVLSPNMIVKNKAPQEIIVRRLQEAK